MVPQPLRGKLVVELSQYIAAPVAGQLLADFGAEVIKVEAPGGDGSRGLPGTEFGSVYTRSFNTSKSSLVIDTREDADRERLFELLTRADALVSNLSPAALAKLGLAPAEARQRFPRLVVTLISGYGQDDPRTCLDTIAQCESGFAWINGADEATPQVAAGWPIDVFSGMYAAMSTAMALADPTRTEGCVVDVAMLEVATGALMGPAALTLAEGGALGAPTGNRDRASAPSSIYPCRDGHIYIYGGLDPFWKKLRPLVGGEERPIAERIGRAAEYDAMVADWTGQRPRAEVLATLQELGVPAGAVRHPGEALDLLRQARPGAVSAQTATGEYVPSFPVIFDGERPARTPAPVLGGERGRR